jgi:gamma-glutamylaminecyclotransferase
MGTVLFVYGTLKRGERNHRLMADQRFLGPAVTAAKYRVIDLGPHPVLIPDAEHGLSVTGELWEVSDCALDELDEFEGIPDPFDRRAIEIMGDERSVQAYFWVRGVPPGTRSGDCWPLG